jgi:hypothetical protein
MSITLSLTPEMEQSLAEGALEQGLSTEDYALQLLVTAMPDARANGKLARLLQEWVDEDDVEDQRVTGDYLIQALDEDRLSDRLLYPEESVRSIV